MLVRQPSRWGRVAVLAPALVVAACAVAATAHGGYEVAVACQVGRESAWLYPVITDGLALVAYASTHRLRAGACRYAWAVVVGAAALSGLAQAVYLASGPALVTSAALRFGVGAWPAVAGAVTAHLVYLLARRSAPPMPQPGRGPLPVPAGPSPTLPPAAGEPGDLREIPPTHLAPAWPTLVGDDADRAAVLIAGGAGRRTVARELGITEYEARQLIDAQRGVRG